MFNNILSKIKENMQKINKKINLKNIAVIALIVMCFFVFNLGDLLNNVFTSLANLFTNVDGEIKELVIESEGYDTEGGSYKITKKGDWISTTEVQLEYELESIAETNTIYKDVVLVLDISKSMEETRIDDLKSSTSDLVKTLLSKNDNKVGIVSFSTSAKVESKLTNDEQVLLNAIEGLVPNGDTNYYQALLKLEELLVGYQEEANRELIVIFITDGYPNIDTPNEKAQYKLIKNKYPKMKIHGIRYETGVLDAIKDVSDYQYLVGNNLNLGEMPLYNVLMEAALSPEYYETFQVEETINNEYFEVSKVDIMASTGDVEIIEENGTQKIVWTSEGDIRSGSTQKMSIKLTVKDDKQKIEGLWNISTLTEADLVLTSGTSHRLSSTESLKLKSGYKVKYEANAPAGCNASINLEETHYAYENVKFTNQKLECDGYQFGGWEVVEEVVTINDDVFRMPTYNVTVRGIWKQLSLDKTMDGEVYEKLTLYKEIAKQAQLDTNIDFSKVNGTTNGNGVYTVESTKDDTNPIHYFRGNVNNNNVIFGGYCWKIVRTTETGGVKMVYNGTPVEGKCTNTTGTATQIGTSAFNSSNNSPAYVGYMYGTVYQYKTKDFSLDYNVLTVKSKMENTNYIYGTEISYNGEQYDLINTSQKTWESNYENLVGYYTCHTTTETTCSTVYYVVGSDSGKAYEIEISEGKSLNDIDNMYMSKTVSGKTLVNPIVVKKSDWFRKYENYKDYYVCSNPTSATCSKLCYIGSVTNKDYTCVDSNNNYLYGNDVIYSNGEYKLVDTKEVWNWAINYDKMNNYHYTCFNDSGECTEVYYIYYTENSYANYITLKNGKKVEDALNDMFNNDDINQKDSTIKIEVDNWYANNMTDYTKYLEDTVWCNDRSISTLNGWSPNDGSTIEYDFLRFSSYDRNYDYTPSFECRDIDSFTLKVEKGGTAGYGNNKLDYPVGLLTADELTYAGAKARTENTNYYLSTGQTYHLLSPYRFGDNSAAVFYVYENGMLRSSYRVNSKYGIRPTISLKPDIVYTMGNGTPSNPYVIKLEQ